MGSGVGDTLSVDVIPPRVIIDYATKCNLRCGMCPVWGKTEESPDSVVGVMDPQKARGLVEQIPGSLVLPSLYGEPLLIPNLKEVISGLKRNGNPVTINTNGLTLTEDIASFFVKERVDSVMFSIDAFSPPTLKLVRGIWALWKIEKAVDVMLKARGDAEFPRIGVSFTVQDENRHELKDFEKKWVGKVDVVRIGLVFEGGKFTDMKDPGKRKPCPALYTTMPVHNDGSVTICCLDSHRKTNVGNVFTDGVQKVWNEGFRKVRKAHEEGRWDDVPMCKGCNGWAQYEFEEEEREGILVRTSPQYVYYNRIDRLSSWKGALRGGHKLSGDR